MIGIITLASLVLATYAAGPPAGWWAGPRAGAAIDAAKSYLNSRSDVNQLRLDRVTAALERAEAAYKSLDKHDDHEVDHLEERVNQITGNYCKQREFQCGATDGIPQCISNLLVCDGSPDCNNGHDEDADVCVNLVTEGSSWSWDADWGTCVGAQTHSGKMLITSVKRSKYFSSQVKLGVTITTDDDNDEDHLDHAISSSGLYTFAGRRLIVFPGTPGFPATVCHFELGNDDHCSGVLIKEDSWQKCGTISAKRHN